MKERENEKAEKGRMSVPGRGNRERGRVNRERKLKRGACEIGAGRDGWDAESGK